MRWAVERLAASSSSMPRSASPRQTAARVSGEFSPMPPAKARASSPPSSTRPAPIQWRMEATNTSMATCARRLPAAAASSRSRMSPEVPDIPASPLRLDSSPSRSSKLLPVAFCICSSTNGSQSPARLFCGSPDCGLMPIEVPTLLPSAIQQTLLEPPRWQEMARSGRFGSVSMSLVATKRWLAPWNPNRRTWYFSTHSVGTA